MRRSFATALVAIGLAGSVFAFRGQGKPASGCDADNAGLTLPPGFCAGVFARGVPSARHIAIASNGDVFVISNPGGGRGRGTAPPRGVFRIRDANRDGKADSSEIALVASSTGSGVWVTKDALYAEDQGTRPQLPPGTPPGASNALAWTTMIVRYPFKPGTTELTGATDTIVTGFPTGGHATRDFVIRGDELYVNVGSASNACTQGGGRSGLPVTQPDPCPELPTRAGIWLFSATKTHQTFDSEHRFVTGLRNGVGITLNTADNSVYSTQHGRDDLGTLGHQSVEYNAENPAEELVKLKKGADYGWPYCYYSVEEKKMVLAPEHGGDGKIVGRCAKVEQPLYAFPAHWAPNASLFYTGSQFPALYRGGTFVAFHGSWNRAPLAPGGYNVTFLPMKGGTSAGPHQVFADGFYGDKSRNPATPGDHRPAGLAQMLDGSLLVSDDAAGLVYHIVYTGK